MTEYSLEMIKKVIENLGIVKCLITEIDTMGFVTFKIASFDSDLLMHELRQITANFENKCEILHIAFEAELFDYIKKINKKMQNINNNNNAMAIKMNVDNSNSNKKNDEFKIIGCYEVMHHLCGVTKIGICHIFFCFLLFFV